MYLLFSTIVIRPSRMAIALGLMLLYLVLGLVLYTGWIHDMEIPDCSEDGLIIKIFYEVNPCYSVFRSLSITSFNKKDLLLGVILLLKFPVIDGVRVLLEGMQLIFYIH